ncbi:MAG TPA: hypothetical protein VFS20_33080 [Longimicrobium sp.]|nr:hypothetical protein [Longimicrobium sp.]
MKKLSFGLLAMLAACQSDPTGAGETTRRLGTVEFHADPVRIVAPATVQAGVPFTVQVTTYGGGCVTQGDTEAAVTGSEAQVTVYDMVYEPRPNEGCTMELRMFEHTATLQFAQAGPATLRVRGWKEPAGQEITLTRQIVVQ